MVFVWWRNFGHLGISPRIPSRRNGDLAHMHSKLIPSAPNIYQINHFTAHCTQTKKYYLHIISRKPIPLHIWTRRSMTNGWTTYMYIVVQYYLVVIQYWCKRLYYLHIAYYRLGGQKLKKWLSYNMEGRKYQFQIKFRDFFAFVILNFIAWFSCLGCSKFDSIYLFIVSINPP